MYLTLQDIISANPELYEPSTPIIGDPTAKFEALRSPQSATATSISFVSSKEDFDLAFSKGVRIFVLGSKLKDHPHLSQLKAYAFSKSTILAMAKFSDRFFPDRVNQYIDGIHPTAVVYPDATVGKNVRIGAHSVVGPKCKIADGVSIGHNTTLEAEVEVGENSNIDSNVFLGRRTILGKHCMIKPMSVIGSMGYGITHDIKGTPLRVPQMGRVVLEDYVEIGSGCTIDRATLDETRIGAHTKMDNLVHIAHNTKIGKNGLIAGKFATAGSATIGDNFMCGGRVSVTDHVTITNNVMIGGMSGVSNDVEKPGAYAGYPLQPLKDHLRSTASLKYLPQIRKDLARLFKHLGLSRKEGEE